MNVSKTFRHHPAIIINLGTDNETPRPPPTPFDDSLSVLNLSVHNEDASVLVKEGRVDSLSVHV